MHIRKRALHIHTRALQHPATHCNTLQHATLRALRGLSLVVDNPNRVLYIRQKALQHTATGYLGGYMKAQRDALAANNHSEKVLHNICYCTISAQEPNIYAKALPISPQKSHRYSKKSRRYPQKRPTYLKGHATS